MTNPTVAVSGEQSPSLDEILDEMVREINVEVANAIRRAHHQQTTHMQSIKTASSSVIRDDWSRMNRNDPATFMACLTVHLRGEHARHVTTRTQRRLFLSGLVKTTILTVSHQGRFYRLRGTKKDIRAERMLGRAPLRLWVRTDLETWLDAVTATQPTFCRPRV